MHGTLPDATKRDDRDPTQLIEADTLYPWREQS